MNDCDIYTIEERSILMSKVGSKDTSPEIVIRKALFKKGFRYRLHKKDLPGKPDIVLSKYKTVVFVNGCFWHQHVGCKKATIPKTNHLFWENKLNKNIIRDQNNYLALKKMGWNVLLIWECQINKNFDQVMEDLIINFIK